jgi:hypothetical protein
MLKSLNFKQKEKSPEKYQTTVNLHIKFIRYLVRYLKIMYRKLTIFSGIFFCIAGLLPTLNLANNVGSFILFSALTAKA